MVSILEVNGRGMVRDGRCNMVPKASVWEKTEDGTWKMEGIYWGEWPDS